MTSKNPVPNEGETGRLSVPADPNEDEHEHPPRKTEKADDDLSSMSKKITRILATEKNSDFICKLILFMFLLTVLGVCAQQMRKKLD